MSSLREDLEVLAGMVQGVDGSVDDIVLSVMVGKLFDLATEAIEENERLREALKTILRWREYDCPDNIHRCPCALASVEDTAREALEGARHE